jgi:DNA-directed RNA polymerase specialized sigma24 family protein
MEDKTDHELVQEYRLGSHEAFEVLYMRYRRRLYVYANTLLRSVQEAQDAMQEVFAKLIANGQCATRQGLMPVRIMAGNPCTTVWYDLTPRD